MSGLVKEIGHRQVYDISKAGSRGPWMLTYGVFGFRLLGRGAGQPAADVLVGAVLTIGCAIRD